MRALCEAWIHHYVKSIPHTNTHTHTKIHHSHRRIWLKAASQPSLQKPWAQKVFINWMKIHRHTGKMSIFDKRPKIHTHTSTIETEHERTTATGRRDEKIKRKIIETCVHWQHENNELLVQIVSIFRCSLIISCIVLFLLSCSPFLFIANFFRCCRCYWMIEERLSRWYGSDNISYLVTESLNKNDESVYFSIILV